MVVSRIPHLFISFSTGHGHAVPIICFARRLIDMPNALAGSDVTPGLRCIVTIATVNSYVDDLVATGLISSPDENGVIFRGSYGEVRLAKLYDLPKVDPQEDDKYLPPPMVSNVISNLRIRLA
ncbi:uncharacterized protein VTP21DRAFT_4768 [Calcarisporiella thermophila]|uniref:uncharacterized protein n=1 Tax=Calcarisporiella thermophila TaxID=911321 RepID=UPI0037435F12